MPFLTHILRWATTVVIFLPLLSAFAATPNTTLEAETILNKTAEELEIEISLGQLAVQRATNKEVKEFGRQMVMEHEKVGQQVEALALKQHVKLSPSPSHKNNQKLEELSQLSGHAFDREYMNYSMQTHQTTAEEFQKLAGIVDDPEIKQWLALLVPILESHREKAQRVKYLLQTNP